MNHVATAGGALGEFRKLCIFHGCFLSGLAACGIDGTGRRLGRPAVRRLEIPAMALQIDVPFAASVGVDFDGMAFVAPVNRYGEFAIKSNFDFRIVFDVPFHFRIPHLILCVPLTVYYYTTVTKKRQAKIR